MNGVLTYFRLSSMFFRFCQLIECSLKKLNASPVKTEVDIDVNTVISRFFLSIIFFKMFFRLILFRPVTWCQLFSSLVSLKSGFSNSNLITDSCALIVVDSVSFLLRSVVF